VSPSRVQQLATVVRRFPRVRLAVVGDLMLDQFIWGKVSRISPEAPVPVVQVTRESFHLGGAANVAANVRALGGRIAVIGVVGRDAHGTQLLDDLRSIGAGVAGVLRRSGYSTTRKTRIIAHQQQVVRLDREVASLDGRIGAAVSERVRRSLGSVDGLVISDYAKGVISPELLALLGARAGGRPFVFIDPKRGNFPHYAGATLVKPNIEAAAAASGIEIRDERTLRMAGERLLALWRAEAVLISRGEEGMTLFRRGKKMQHFSTVAREVYDVTGAGDTVLSTAALALAAGASFEDAAVLANHAAGLVVAKVGTATVTAEELIADLRHGERP
jgi:rfaE bifunctional protein kinase chain/domain